MPQTGAGRLSERGRSALKADPIFELKNLRFTYPEQTRPALDGVSLALAPGDFAVLCGPSGCGKTTLLKQLKSVLAPHGTRSGEVLFDGGPLAAVPAREQSARIGFLLQDPDDQLVTDKVWHELAFGLESLGMPTPVIRARVAEMASFFGIADWFYRDVSTLSGGQKQLLNLASVMAMSPDVLLLDEPTSRLDPVAAGDFLATVGRLNRELGTTVLLTEHRLGEVFPLANRVFVLDEGRLVCEGAPRAVGEALRGKDARMFRAMPAPMRVWAAIESGLPCPVTVREGRDFLTAYAETHPLSALPDEPSPVGDKPVLSLENVWFKYEKDSPDVLRGLTLTARAGELLAVLGGNGAGKTTALTVLAGLQKPYRGKVSLRARAGMLPQDPRALFVKKTVREDLAEMLTDSPLSKEQRSAREAYVTRLCRLDGLLDRHPFDLSGGEQQRAALAKVLLLNPQILLLDEPTKGLDGEFKDVLAEILRTLCARGVTVVLVSHDLDFCSEHADRCALLFDGAIVSEGAPRAFFSGNSFYTTAANRMARHLLPEAVTVSDVVSACGGAVSPPPALPPDDGAPLPDPPETAYTPPKLPLWRRCLAWGAGVLALLCFLGAVGLLKLPAPFAEGYRSYYFLIASLFILALATASRSEGPIENAQVPREKRKLSRRSVFGAVVCFVLVPLTVFVGVFYFGDRKYYFISLLVLLETMLPFFLLFEGRRPQARELVLISVLCALGVAGRAAFAALPEFKPVMAVVITAAVAFGGETGFLVGAVTMLVSNLFFGQGPFTPWQMFAMGLVGFLAGVLFQKGLLRRTRGSLAAFGAVAAIVVYGGIMNPAAALMAQPTVNRAILLAYYATGFPIDCIQAAATAFFLWFFSRPMLEKLDRVKAKYGLTEP